VTLLAGLGAAAVRIRANHAAWSGAQAALARVSNEGARTERLAAFASLTVRARSELAAAILHPGAEAVLLAELASETIRRAERAAASLVRRALAETPAHLGVTAIVALRDTQTALGRTEAVSATPLDRRAVSVRCRRAHAVLLTAGTERGTPREARASGGSGTAIVGHELAAPLLLACLGALTVGGVGGHALSTALGAVAARLALELAALGVAGFAGACGEEEQQEQRRPHASYATIFR